MALLLASCQRASLDERLNEWYVSTRVAVLEQPPIKPDSTYEYIDVMVQRREKYYYFDNRLVKETFSDNRNHKLYEAIYANHTNLRVVNEYCRHGFKTYEGIDYDNKPLGPGTWYDCKNGKLICKGNRVGFKKYGTWRTYNNTGQVVDSQIYEQESDKITLPEIVN